MVLVVVFVIVGCVVVELVITAPPTSTATNDSSSMAKTATAASLLLKALALIRGQPSDLQGIAADEVHRGESAFLVKDARAGLGEEASGLDGGEGAGSRERLGACRGYQPRGSRVDRTGSDGP